ncbi:alpha/beta fold hydrolase, partial [Algiphilus sp.]|uniref:alpha/beta fold hydrolase n=1 Tax=Algiphilus sp. TaxID=1872431 RepID=UPI003C455183
CPTHFLDSETVIVSIDHGDERQWLPFWPVSRALAASALRQRQFADILEESPHLEERLKELPTPTHILWGEEDRLIHVDCVRVLRELLPNSSATVLRGVGHIPMLETPAKAAQDYLAFRERLIFGTDLLPEVA